MNVNHTECSSIASLTKSSVLHVFNYTIIGLFIIWSLLYLIFGRAKDVGSNFMPTYLVVEVHLTSKQLESKGFMEGKYQGVSKVLQYFSNMKRNSAALDALAEIGKVTYHTWTMRSWGHLVVSECDLPDLPL